MSPVLVNRTLLIAAGLLSLCLTTAVNGIAGGWLKRNAPQFALLADATIPSMLASLIFYLAVRPERPFAPPPRSTNWPPIIRLCAIYLAIWVSGSALVACIRGGWRAYTHEAAPLFAFVLVAPLAEEIMFRGTLFELAERSSFAFPAAPIWITSILFGLQHFQLHGYRADSAALTQAAFTFPMGLVFATVRSRSRSIWPALILHILTNVTGAFGQ